MHTRAGAVKRRSALACGDPGRGAAHTPSLGVVGVPHAADGPVRVRSGFTGLPVEPARPHLVA
jgi:hypothetical protein